MPKRERIPLVGGAYQSRSLIASAQRCVNLYSEANPPEGQPPTPVTHYLTPGLRLLATAPNLQGVRCAYTATNGDFYVVIGPTVYYVNPAWAFTYVGSIADALSPVSMADNGKAILIVNGTASGWAIDLATKSFGAVPATNFFGADKVDQVDSYFVLNRPRTNQFYISLTLADFAALTGGTAFSALDIAYKAIATDNIVSLIALQRSIWIAGAETSEIWVNSGAASFTFVALAGASIEHGCAAKNSIAKEDTSAFWLAKDRRGQGIVVQSDGYGLKRISTHAIEAEFQTYARLDDAIGFTFQQQGHAFYRLTFPSADKSWGYEEATRQWHELASIDGNGVLHRHRANCFAQAYGTNVVGDFQNGNLYELDPDTFTDNGTRIPRIRTFPHLIEGGDRVSYPEFIADMQPGTLDPANSDDPPMISLRWSDDRGATYGNKVLQSMGAGGQFLTQIKWSRTGMARDRVFELSWDVPAKTALNGAFVRTVGAAS